MAATPSHSLPRVSQCGQGSYSLDRRHPATLIAHCASSSPALPMSLGSKQLLWHDAPVSSPFFQPSLIFLPVPRPPRTHAFPKLHSAAHNHPPLASDCVNWCGPPSLRFYACCTPTPSQPHILSPLLVVTSEFKISVDIHLNDYLAPNCG